MVFPVETEERIRRRVLSLSQDHIRMVVEATRKLHQLVDAFIKGDLEAAENRYNELMKLDEEIVVARRSVFKELAEIGAILVSREDFVRFIILVSEIADLCEGAAFRLLETIKRGLPVNERIKMGLLKLSEGTLTTVFKLREMVLSLSYDSAKTLEKARDVENAEKMVDELYRSLGIEIINSDLKIPTILLLRDVCEFLEDIADKAEDASDAAGILSLVM
ncbi:MAG: DUF47 family protein [Candidatus Bathyarchaeia archaeon]